MTGAYGYLAVVLHAHLPYVRHPEHDSFFEETWLFEAITECYVPLICMLERLRDERIPARIALSLSPTLLGMLRDPLLLERYDAYLDRMLRLAEREVARTCDNPDLAPLAGMYRARLEDTRRSYAEVHGRDLPAAFSGLRDAGLIDLMTSTATHGYLPLLRTEPQAVRAQLQTGQKVFESLFGAPSEGLWLPECAYYRGLEEEIEAAGFRYFFVDSHGIAHARPRPVDGTLAPIALPNGIAAFGRDPDSSRQVWSRDEGYPGDHWYRDFYRDIGFDLDMAQIGPFLPDGATRLFTGFKYHRITGPTDDKALYDPVRAAERIADHAAHFVAERRAAVIRHGPLPGPKPILVAPYDAELFGHWWFEGPQWLEAVLRGIAEGSGPVALATPADYLTATPRLQGATPSPSSWGERGFNEFWLNPGNDWIYPHLHAAARRMRDLARGASGSPDPESSLRGRALRQAARSLLLAQASDWPFIMKAGTAVSYAQDRVRDHLARFGYLERALLDDDIDARKLQTLEYMDNLFPEIDPSVFV